MEKSYNNNSNINEEGFDGNFQFVENKLLESSRYTQKTEASQDKIDEYNNNYLIKYTEEELSFLRYDTVLKINSHMLYFENDSNSIVLIDKITNFKWSSRAEHQHIDDVNNLFRNQINSGIGN